jgi:hypothetical protein
MTMQYLPSDLTCAEEDLKDVPVSSHGDAELSRQIFLLQEEVHRDRINALRAQTGTSCVVDPAALEQANEAIDKALAVFEGELRDTYFDYASCVLAGVGGSLHENLRLFRAAYRRLRATYGRYLSLRTIERLGIARVLLALQGAEKAVAVELLKLETIALAACLRVPLFSYGPELSRFRLRLRLTLA